MAPELRMIWIIWSTILSNKSMCVFSSFTLKIEKIFPPLDDRSIGGDKRFSRIVDTIIGMTVNNSGYFQRSQWCNPSFIYSTTCCICSQVVGGRQGNPVPPILPIKANSFQSGWYEIGGYCRGSICRHACGSMRWRWNETWNRRFSFNKL